MELGLKGKVVFVTGGGTGIGKATALEFAREGAKTYIGGRRANRLDEAAEEAKAEGLTLLPHVIDVADIESIEKTVSDVAEENGGRIDVWVNNAGYGAFRMLPKQDEKHWFDTVDINMKSIVFTTKYVSAVMKQRKSGVIVNASSLAAYIPLAGNAIYAAVKSGVVTLTKTYASELGPYGIRVLSYAPGMVVSEMNTTHVRDDYDNLVSTMALGRLGKADELAKPIVFFASDAAGYITGVDILLSGGRLCSQNNGDMWKAAGADAIVPERVEAVEYIPKQ